MELIVAVVDDDRRVLESIENLLESAGHKVEIFSSGPSLLSSPGLHRIACLVSDVAMPGMDGFELRRRVRAVRPDLPVIFLSGQDLSGVALTQAQHSEGFLRKPFEGAELISTVIRAMHGTFDGEGGCDSRR